MTDQHPVSRAEHADLKDMVQQNAESIGELTRTMAGVVPVVTSTAEQVQKIWGVQSRRHPPVAAGTVIGIIGAVIAFFAMLVAFSSVVVAVMTVIGAMAINPLKDDIKTHEELEAHVPAGQQFTELQTRFEDYAKFIQHELDSRERQGDSLDNENTLMRERLTALETNDENQDEKIETGTAHRYYLRDGERVEDELQRQTERIDYIYKQHP